MLSIFENFSFWTVWPWAIVLFGIIVLVIGARRAKRRREQDRLEAALPQEDEELVEGEPGEGIFGSLTPALAAQIPESGTETKDFDQLLRSAGLYSPSARTSIYAVRFILLFLPLIATGVLVVSAPSEYTFRIVMVGILVAAGLSIIPRLYVFARQRSRVREIRHGLADMMDMLSMCLSGGLPITPSLDHVSKHLQSCPALSEELQILKRQADVGSLKLALRDFARRIPMPEVRQLSGLLARGEQLGTQLSKSLLEQSDHFRQTRKQMATMQANKTPIKLSLPLLFCFAPAALILLMSPAMLELREFLNPEGGSPLRDQPSITESVSGVNQQPITELSSPTTPTPTPTP